MGFLKDKKSIALFAALLVTIILLATSFIMFLSGKGYCSTPSPIISANVSNIYAGENITVSGQNFTPNGMAILYVAPVGITGNVYNYSANVDKNGNTSWPFNVGIGPYSIYALCGNSMSRKPNTITISARLNDAPVSPVPFPIPSAISPVPPITPAIPSISPSPHLSSTLSTSPSSNSSSIPSIGPYAYIPNNDDNTVSVIDTHTNTVIATIPVGVGPSGVAVNPSGTRVYVTNSANAGTISGQSTVSVIDTSSNKVIATIPVGAYPWGIAVNPSGTEIYVVSETNNTVSVINASTNKVTAIIPVGRIPTGIAVNPAGTRVYVTSSYGPPESNIVSVIDTATNSVIATVPVGFAPIGVAVNPAGTRVYVANGASDNVSVIDAATNTVIATVPIGKSLEELSEQAQYMSVPLPGYIPEYIAVNPAGTKVYVVNTGNSNVSVIDTMSNTVIANIKVGLTPEGVSLTSDGTKIYVVNTGSNNVSVIDPATDTVIASVPVGNSPSAFGQFITPAPLLSSTPSPSLPLLNDATPWPTSATTLIILVVTGCVLMIRERSKKR